MDQTVDPDVTELLGAARAGERGATERLYRAIYPQLRVLASAKRRNWNGNDTLDTTSLVHEAFIKLAGTQSHDWRDRQHFFRTAARAMRHILINYAQERCAAKRGGTGDDLTLHEERAADASAPEAIVALGQLLEQLEAFDPRLAQVFECRRFGGYTIKETALALDLSVATVKRDYDRALAWLRRAMTASRPSA